MCRRTASASRWWWTRGWSCAEPSSTGWTSPTSTTLSKGSQKTRRKAGKVKLSFSQKQPHFKEITSSHLWRQRNLDRRRTRVWSSSGGEKLFQQQGARIQNPRYTNTFGIHAKHNPGWVGTIWPFDKYCERIKRRHKLTHSLSQRRKPPMRCSCTWNMFSGQAHCGCQMCLKWWRIYWQIGASSLVRWKLANMDQDQLCGQDTCQGDSGGPLWTEVNGRAVLIGSLVRFDISGTFFLQIFL